VSKSVYYCAASLDGFIAESDHGLDWLTKYEGTFEGESAEPMKGSYDHFYEGIGANVMGSATYEFVLEHMAGGHMAWPYADKPTWVLSSRKPTRADGAGDELRIVEAKVTDLYDEMIASAGERDLWVIGGGNVASQFADAGLLDELIITVTPVVLGDGKPLFDRRLPGGALRLVGTRTWDSGMVELRYAIKPDQSAG